MARQDAPRQWEHWWWVWVAGEVVFVPTTLLLTGRWRRSAALADRSDHDRAIDAELALLHPGTTATASEVRVGS